MSKLELTRCAACRKEKPVSEMKTCMHNQMHHYVCDAKCMNDFYNPPPKQDQHAADKERIADLTDLCERLKQEAQIHAQEARTANATIAEIYRIVSGGKGEPGNWNGAEPVRKRIAELEAERKEVRDLLKAMFPKHVVESLAALAQQGKEGAK